MPYYIGADLGTSSLKLLLADEHGGVCRTVSKSYPIFYPAPGQSEQNPADWWDAFVSGVRELTQDIPPNRIRGIALGGQMHGLVILDENDRVIRPAILWNDGRTEEQTAYLNQTVGKERLLTLTGNIAFAGFTAPKLLWLREHEPEQFGRIRRIMLPKDYITYRLTGRHVTDYSDASGLLLLDVENRRWSEEMLALCGIGPMPLPELAQSDEAVGKLRPEAAAQLGLTEDVTVAAGAGDNAAAAVGTGTVQSGACNISVGTSGTVFVCTDRFRTAADGAIHSFCHADGGYHLMGCILSAASCNKWFVKDILGGDFEKEQASVTDEMLGRDPVFFLPYLMGERSPLNDTAARGAFIGMRANTSRADLVQAVMEGVAFAIRDNLEIIRAAGVGISRSGLCGGGAKSPLWRKIFCNVLGIELDIPEIEEGPAYGAAMLAMVAAGEYPDLAACAKALTGVKETLRPDPAIRARYDAQYARFKMLYPALKNFFNEIK